MIINILTLFPETFDSVFSQSILNRAVKNKVLRINIINIRNFSAGNHKQVDDKPYGGGEGMVLMADPIKKAITSIKEKTYTILLSASGYKFTQKKAGFYSKKKSLTLICGHYEGIDARVEEFVDEVITIGDFILTGGEIAAMAVVDSTIRLVKGTINPLSPLNESFEGGLLEYPQYTRPENYEGLKVPQVLLSGNHKEIANWRLEQSRLRTKKYRPELITG